MTITIEEPATKYETKRTGLTCDEALEATVMGYRVRSPSIQADAYIHYPGEGGWRIQFVHDGREGSSCKWEPERKHWLADWEIVPLPSEVKRDAWGKPIVNIIAQMGGEDRPPNKHQLADEARKSKDSWGRPIDGIA